MRQQILPLIRGRVSGLFIASGECPTGHHLATQRHLKVVGRIHLQRAAAHVNAVRGKTA